MKIYITLDYELKLEVNPGTVKNCLIRPMNQLMKICDKHNVKLNIFVDSAYLYRILQLKDGHPALVKDYDDVVENVKLMNEKGHSIQYHFHPQWLFSEYDDEKGWLMDFDHYKLSDVPQSILDETFSKGVELLNSITGKKVCAFRAGGYSLCSSDYYIPLFEKNGIKVDSSVLTRYHVKSKLQTYDYRRIPDKSRYYFYDNVCEEVSGNSKSFIEMPISVSNGISSIKYIINKKKWEKELNPKVVYADGGGGGQMPKFERLKQLLAKFFGKIHIRSSIDNIDSINLWRVYKDNKDRGRNELVVIGHPKITSDASLRNVEKWIGDMISEGNKFHTLDELV